MPSYQMYATNPGFQTEFIFTQMDDGSVVMHCLVKADDKSAFLVQDTSELPKLYLVYERSDCAYLPREGYIEAKELATLDKHSKIYFGNEIHL
jgi:hypothetical protein